MNKAKHTPGPWAIVNREIRGPAESGVIVARIPEWGVAADAPDPFAANARLLAAAPDLLEALHTIIRQPGFEPDEPYGVQALAAIAKAEGAA